jgi:hypothetical protein
MVAVLTAETKHFLFAKRNGIIPKDSVPILSSQQALGLRPEKVLVYGPWYKNPEGEGILTYFRTLEIPIETACDTQEGS